MRGSRGEVGLTRGRSWTIMQTWQCPGQLDREPVGQRYCLWPMLEWNGWVLLSMPYLVPGCGLPWKGYDIGWVSLSHFLLDHSTWGCQPSWCEVALQRGSRGDGLRDHVSELGSGPFKPLPPTFRWDCSSSERLGYNLRSGLELLKPHAGSRPAETWDKIFVLSVYV